MKFNGFKATDFNVFKINGLEPRMEALQSRIRPKLDYLGTHFAQELSVLSGQELFPHVAKHARRSVNPPDDTWVAFAANKRGYKMMPHFQIGLWETHVFIWYAVIYEAPMKADIGKHLQENVHTIRKNIPEDFVWSIDHTKPDTKQHKDLSDEELENMFIRLQNVKKAEILCGYQIPREQALELDGEAFINKCSEVFVQLLPLYKME
ncbi:YktB family protein [Bacillus sp. 1P06AnD]|uniref:YktB family protein n=1 Tax=Bacillus sp. 1P06AnD TaxID=3132208 RepID=UPI00399F9C86